MTDSDFLLHETVTIRGRDFVVSELVMDDLLMLTEEGITDEERSKRIIRAAVTHNGQPVEPGRLPASLFSELSKVVARLNGLDVEETEDAPGNVPS